jgi:hypothetical protein
MATRAPLFASVFALSCLVGGPAAFAQSSVPSISVPQAIVSGTVGNGVQQSAPILTVPSQGQPLIGVGALSGGSEHYGSTVSLSVLNSNRLLGVDGPGGAASALSISLPNPRQAPILSKAK